jgi:16S rRNA (adenine1518-N6/adenine1519-N6)-dimethyltransferase
VVKIDFDRGRVAVKSEKAFRQVVKCAFLNRRKTLENNLVNYFSISREQAKTVMSKAEIDEKARGETLSPARLALLTDTLIDEGVISGQ